MDGKRLWSLGLITFTVSPPWARGCFPMVSTLLFFHGPVPPRTRSCWARRSFLLDNLFIPTATSNLCSSLSNTALSWGFSLESIVYCTRTVLIPCGGTPDVLHRSHRSQVTAENHTARDTLVLSPPTRGCGYLSTICVPHPPLSLTDPLPQAAGKGPRCRSASPSPLRLTVPHE